MNKNKELNQRVYNWQRSKYCNSLAVLEADKIIGDFSLALEAADKENAELRQKVSDLEAIPANKGASFYAEKLRAATAEMIHTRSVRDMVLDAHTAICAEKDALKISNAESIKQIGDERDTMKALIDYLCEEQPAFAEDLLNGHGLLESFDGHFVAWDEIIEACGNGMEGYGDSPVELINRIINERDELKEEIAVIQKAGYSDNSVIEQARQEGREMERERTQFAPRGISDSQIQDARRDNEESSLNRQLDMQDAAKGVMQELKRENRYMVLKRDYIADFLLTPEAKAAWNTIQKIHDAARKQRGKGPLVCVVVESDWPEYEPTWKAIEQRMTGKPPSP